MTRFIVIVAAFLVVAPQVAVAQTLVDVAKAEEERRKAVKKPAKVYTNEDLKPDFTDPVTPSPDDPNAPATADAKEDPVKPGAAAVNLPLAPDPADAAASGQKDREYWSGRMSTARAALERSRTFAAALQSRLNALATDIINRDDPAQRSVLEQERTKALAELERLKEEIEEQTKGIADIETEARRAGVPPGWLR